MKLSNYKIQTRVFSALIIPVIGMILFSGYITIQQYNVGQNNAKLVPLMSIAPDISNMVHEMQKERGQSAVFIGTRANSQFQKLEKQRLETKAKHALMKKTLASFDASIYDQELSDRIQTAQKALSKFDIVRSEVSSLNRSVPQMASYYTGTIAKLLNVISYATFLSTDINITKAVNSYENFLQAKERMGVERAMGAGGFGKNRFSPKIYKKFVSLISAQDIYLSRFGVFAEPHLKDFFKNTVKGRDIDEVKRMREVALSAGENVVLNGSVTGPYWYDTITNKINLMKVVEDKIADDLMAKVQTLKENGQKGFIMVLSISIALLVGIGAFGLILVRSIVRPIGEATSGLQSLADNDLTLDITGTERKDEIGDIAKTMLVFKENAIEREKLSKAQEADNKTRLERADNIENLITNFEQVSSDLLGTLSSAATEMEATSQSMAHLAEQTTERSSTVAAAAEEAGANVDGVAAATEEMSTSIQEIRRQMQQSADATKNATVSVQDTEKKIEELSKSADQINNVINLINDIAEQTNLLALNATIEAARAGDAGRGFAVVASEVKTLAAQTAQATEEIATTITIVQEGTRDAVTAIGDVSEIIVGVSETANNVAISMDQQADATEEISKNVQEASSGTREVTKNITTVSSAASESGRSAEEVLDVAKQVAEQSDRMKNEIERFLEDIKTA